MDLSSDAVPAYHLPLSVGRHSTQQRGRLHCLSISIKQQQQQAAGSRQQQQDVVPGLTAAAFPSPDEAHSRQQTENLRSFPRAYTCPTYSTASQQQQQQQQQQQAAAAAAAGDVAGYLGYAFYVNEATRNPYRGPPELYRCCSGTASEAAAATRAEREILVAAELPSTNSSSSSSSGSSSSSSSSSSAFGIFMMFFP
ncbi:hypothetical protein Emed_001358 [Eimeria media]